ncbi:hypothetical protein PF008_g20028 [Phytophthora fragariae]|uniref:RxLR effector protein n=1 Tax=Phytophthora fragariae TaxID=53985 RepID=A0A6G0R0P2_9STRA|nr:hypothetical protein PF008_g20028 [Phytophthora fragariae]
MKKDYFYDAIETECSGGRRSDSLIRSSSPDHPSCCHLRTMRLSYTLLAATAALLASCGPAFAMAESTQVATADRVQPAVVLMNDTPRKRLLRTANTVGVGEDDEEERGWEMLKLLLPARVGKLLEKTPLLKHIPEKHVIMLLNREDLLKKTFQYWAKIEVSPTSLWDVLKVDKHSNKLVKSSSFSSKSLEAIAPPGQRS